MGREKQGERGKNRGGRRGKQRRKQGEGRRARGREKGKKRNWASEMELIGD